MNQLFSILSSISLADYTEQCTRLMRRNLLASESGSGGQ
jgi:hypothetical protein